MPKQQFAKSADAGEVPLELRADAPPSIARASAEPCPTVRAMRGAAEAREAPCPPPEDDRNDLSLEYADIVDRTIHYAVSRLTLGLSPAAIAEAYFDWLVHLAAAPGKQSQLWQKGLRKWMRLGHFIATCASSGGKGECCIEPLPHDKRFAGEAWNTWPYNALQQAFLLQQQWWHNATTGVRGVTEKHERQVEFMTRQMLDVFSPSNFVLTNPEVLQKTQAEWGTTWCAGSGTSLEDWRAHRQRPPAGRHGGVQGRRDARDHARQGDLPQPLDRAHPVRAGDRQGAPRAGADRARLDHEVLHPRPERRQNSLVKYLTEQGFTVFMISWKNPASEDRDLGFEDYRTLGHRARRSTPFAPIIPEAQGARGWAIASAARCSPSRLPRSRATATNGFETLTFLAAQVDFTEPGELTLFIDESQVAFLEDMMWEQGYLDAQQMVGRVPAAALQRSDLVARRPRLSDGRASAGIRSVGLERRFARACPTACTRTICASCSSTTIWRKAATRSTAGRWRLTDIRAPVFAVGTETDHVAPWRSVYKFMPAARYRRHLSADERRPQRRHRLAARKEQPVTIA